MFAVLVENEGYTMMQEMGWRRYLNNDLQELGLIVNDCAKSQTEAGNWCGRVEDGTEGSMRKHHH